MYTGNVISMSVVSAAIALGCGDAVDRAPDAPTIVIRDQDGSLTTAEELRGRTGEFQYEIVGSGSVPAEAEALHQEARAAGARGDYDRALELLAESAKLAPRWAYPVYDTAFTHLLRQDFDAAWEHYRRTVEMEPRGFFTAITALHALTRERNGELPRGTYLKYLALEWIEDPMRKEEQVRRFVQDAPQFAPGWKELATLLADDAERLAAIERGLAATPDAETRGMLEINKALTLHRQGKHEEAIRLLRELVQDSDCTLANEHLAKATLAQFEVQ